MKVGDLVKWTAGPDEVSGCTNGLVEYVCDKYN